MDGTTNVIYNSGSYLVITDFDVSQYNKIRISDFIWGYAFNTAVVNIILNKDFTLLILKK